MSFKTAFLKRSLFVAGVALSMTTGAQAQTATFRLVGGGSSALLGDLRTASYGPGALPQVIGQLGTIPNYKTSPEQVLTVTSTTANPIVITRNLPGGGTATENPDSMQIRFTDAGGGNANVIILLRSDSGNGVRYLSNSARLTSLPSNTGTNYASASATGTTLINNPAIASDFSNGSVVNVLTNITNSLGTGIPIDTGLSDVAADTIVTFAGFGTSGTNGLIASGFSNIKNFDNVTPVQTLLMLYNANVYTGGTGNAFPVNFTRSQVRALINGLPVDNSAGTGRTADSPLWSDIDGRLRSDLYVSTAFRETTSGTRLTEVTNIQRYDRSAGGFLTENNSGVVVNPGTDTANYYHALGTGKNDPNGSNAGSTTIGGTGDVVNAVNTGFTTANAAPDPNQTNNLVNGAVFGYAFITGGAGNNKPNVRVGLFNGVAPYRQNPTSTSASSLNIASDLALPGNNNSAATAQPDYATVGNTTGGVSGFSKPYYTEVINGRYELWSYTHAYTFQATTGSVAASIFGSLNNTTSSLYAPIVHRAGLTQLGEMQAVRAGVNSALIPGATVTDGFFVNLDAAGAIGLSNVLN